MAKIVITGASRGIGFQLTKLAIEAGHEVLALSRNTKPLSALTNSNLKVLAFDLEIPAHCDAVVNFVQTHWENQLDVLIHNAGSITQKPFQEIDIAAWKQIYQTNVFGVVTLTQHLLPFMNKEGHVVMISSMGGVQGSAKFPGLSAYSSSKGALITLTEVLAEEYKDNGPAFNALALGAVQTEMLEEAFPGYQAPIKAQEMADYILQFALQGNKLFNGKIIPVASSTP